VGEKCPEILPKCRNQNSLSKIQHPVIFHCSQTKLCLLPHVQHPCVRGGAGGRGGVGVQEAASSTSLVKGTVTEEQNIFTFSTCAFA